MSRVLPILFNTDMVRAILDGRKTVTRRLIKPQPTEHLTCGQNWEQLLVAAAAPYQPGDTMYVRETWYKGLNRILYKANYSENEKFYTEGKEIQIKWHPSIHMPKEAARIWLKVKDVRVERLQDITEEQVDAEGFLFKLPCLTRVSADGHYCDLDGPCTSSINYCDMSMGELFGKELWNSTIKKSDLDSYGWDANPWVWVIEFEQCEKRKYEQERDNKVFERFAHT